MKWTIKTKYYTTSGLINAETEKEARQLFLKENERYTDKDIIYCRQAGRYNYSTTGYGVFSILGYFYAAGRIEIYDNKSKSGYAIDEGTYWIPLKHENKVRDFFDDLETDLPIRINVGKFEACEQAVSEKTNIPIDKLNDKDERKKFSAKKHQSYLESLDPEERKRLEEIYG